MFPLSRVSYAMAADGLLFECLARINVISKTPLLATMLSGLLSGIEKFSFNIIYSDPKRSLTFDYWEKQNRKVNMYL